jgi:hypothetical protein
MNLFREYLRWYQGPVWTVYAARNQNLSIPTESSIPAHTPEDDSLRPSAQRDGHFRTFWNWIDQQ